MKVTSQKFRDVIIKRKEETVCRRVSEDEGREKETVKEALEATVIVSAPTLPVTFSMSLSFSYPPLTLPSNTFLLISFLALSSSIFSFPFSLLSPSSLPPSSSPTSPSLLLFLLSL